MGGLSNGTTTAEPEPETTSEPVKTLFPEIMTNQETFLLYGGLIFVLFVICIVLLVLYCALKKKVRRLTEPGSNNEMKIHHGV